MSAKKFFMWFFIRFVQYWVFISRYHEANRKGMDRDARLDYCMPIFPKINWSDWL